MKHLVFIFIIGFWTLFLSRLLPTAAQGEDQQHPPIDATNVDQLAELRSWSSHEVGILDVAYNPDGTVLASAGGDSYVRLWDQKNGGMLFAFECPSSYHVAWSPDGNTLATTCQESQGLKLWDATTGALLHTFDAYTANAVYDVAFSPDGTVLASAGNDKTIRLWNPQTGELLRAIEGLGGDEWPDQWPLSVAWSMDGTQLITVNADNHLVWLDVVTGEPQHVIEGVASYPTLSPDGKSIASVVYNPSTGYNAIQLWDAVTGELLHTFEGINESVVGLAFSPDGSLLFAGGVGGLGTFYVWDISTENLLRMMESSAVMIFSLTFSPDGSVMVMGGYGRIVEWSILTEGNEVFGITPSTIDQVTKLRPVINHAGAGVLSMAWSPDETKLVSGGLDMAAQG